MSSKEWQPPTGPRRALRKVKVCPDPECSSLERPPLASWKGLSLFENAANCVVCRCRFIILEEVDSGTYEEYTRNKTNKPRRMKLCIPCPPYRNTAVYSWKGKHTRDFQPEREHEWNRCVVDGCGSRLVEFWDIGYAVSVSRRPSLVSHRSSSFQDRTHNEEQRSLRHDDQPTKRPTISSPDLDRPSNRSRSSYEQRKVHFETEAVMRSPTELRSESTELNIQRELSNATATNEGSVSNQRDYSATTASPKALIPPSPSATRQTDTLGAPEMQEQAPTRDVEHNKLPASEANIEPKSNTNNQPHLTDTSIEKPANPDTYLVSPHPDLYYDDFGLLRFTPEVMQDVLAKLKESAARIAPSESEEVQQDGSMMVEGTRTVEQAAVEEDFAMEGVQTG